MREDFVVMLGPNSFLVEIDGQVVTTASSPEKAVNLSFDLARTFATRLRRRGHPRCRVADRNGNPVDESGNALAAAASDEAARIAHFWGVQQ